MDWYSIAVLYLDVTSVTEFDQHRKCYVCKLNPTAQKSLPLLPQPEPVNVFFSYHREDQTDVKIVFDIVESFFWSAVRPWMDQQELTPADHWVNELIDEIENMNAAFVFIGPNGIGNYQEKEIKAIMEHKCPMVPVILPGGMIPPELEGTQAVILKGSDELKASGQNLRGLL